MVFDIKAISVQLRFWNQSQQRQTLWHHFWLLLIQTLTAKRNPQRLECIARLEFKSTDTQNCAIETENAHPIANGIQTNFSNDIPPKEGKQTARKRERQFSNFKLVNTCKRYHRYNDTDAFGVALGSKRKRDDGIKISVVTETIICVFTSTAKVQSKTSVLNTAKK